MKRTGRALAWGAVATAAVGALAVVLAHGPVARRLTYHPARALAATPASRGLAFDDVFLTATDGVRLHAWHVRVAGPRALVLLFHGNAGNIGDRLPMTAALARARLDVLLLDYRGYGRSEGQPSEEGLYRDAAAALAWAAPRGLPLIFYGESLGGAVAVDLAARRPPAVLVVQDTFTSMSEMADFTLPYGHLIAAERFASIDKIGAVRAKVLVVHGDRDELVPLQMGRRLCERAPGPHELLVVPGARHNEVFARAGPAIVDRITALLVPGSAP